MIRSCRTLLAAVALAFACAAAGAQAASTRLLRQPDISRTSIVFVYGGDLWLVPRAGGTARRLTANPSIKRFPKFSPDGKWIAFTGNYDGNTDIYVIPAEGGEPKRLTYHPDVDYVLGWTPDSKSVLFRSPRTAFTRRFMKAFTVPVTGGMAHELPLPECGLASFSPDGGKIAYNRLDREFATWKRYRGGDQAYISIYDLKNNAYSELPHTDTTDFYPMWHGDKIYFASDRSLTVNLFCYDLRSKSTRQLTHYTDYDVKWPSLGPDAIVYEQGGVLHTYDLETEKESPLTIHVYSDMAAARPTLRHVESNITSYGISPSGARAVFCARGDVFTVPAKKGDTRDLTNTPGVREMNPAWSPDGKSIAYLSDRTGEYELYVRPQDGTGQETRITNDGHVFRYGPVWSPDSKSLMYGDATMKLWTVNVADKTPVLVDSSSIGEIPMGSWSPDSKWIAYVKEEPNRQTAIYLYSMDQKKATRVSTGQYDDRDPVFDKSGKYLYFLSDRTFSPTLMGPEINFNFQNTTGIYALILSKDTPSPFAPESDEEKPKDDAPKPDKPTTEGEKGRGGEEGDAARGRHGDAANPESEPSTFNWSAQPRHRSEGLGQPSTFNPQPSTDSGLTTHDSRLTTPDIQAKQADPTKPAEPVKPAAKAPTPTKIDLEGLYDRIVAIPVSPGSYSSLDSGSEKVFYLAGNALHQYDLAKQADSTILTGISRYDLNPAANKILYSAPGSTYGIVDASPGQAAGAGKLNLDLQMRTDPRAEWNQEFWEAWRYERDFYYDPNMHGLNWKAIGDRYASLVPSVAHRDDLTFLLGELVGELNTSHAYVQGAENPQVPQVGVGLLGVDFEPDSGYYRFKRIYRGENWTSDSRSPLTMPGVNVKEGEYLIAVNSVPLHTDTSPYAPFEGTEGKIVTLRVNSKPTDAGARDVQVRPVSSESGLRYLDWVEGNRRKVEAATGGRVGYVHVPDTSIGGITEFGKGFYSQTDKDALIVDERYNSGGFIPDFFVERLGRKLLSIATPRYGVDFRSPGGAVYGPKVILENEWSGSGGDAFPYFFRKYGIGPIIGKRTWGGLVGISGNYTLMGGGGVTVPQFGIWSPQDGRWVAENHGIDPDMEVSNTPDKVNEGHDPQLERAIAYIQEQLKKNPTPHYQHPPFPVDRVAGNARKSGQPEQR